MLYHEIEKLELEIEHLRNELTERIHMCDMRSEKIIELTDEIELLQSTVTDCRIEVESIRADRDKARRMVCEWHSGLRVQHPQDYAKRRGWDCYKEDGK